MPSSIRRVFFEDYVFQVYRNVYEPAEDSFLFAESLAVKKVEVILSLDEEIDEGIHGVDAAVSEGGLSELTKPKPFL